MRIGEKRLDRKIRIGFKRGYCIALSILLFISMTACNADSAADNTIKYVTTDFTEAAIDPDASYFASKELVLADAAEGELRSVSMMTPCGDGIAVLVAYLNIETGNPKNIVLKYDDQGNKVSEINVSDLMDEGYYKLQIESGINDSLCIFAEGTESKDKIYTIDANDKMSSDPISIAFPDAGFSPANMYVDIENNYYFSGLGPEGVNIIYVFTVEGTLKYSIDEDNLAGNIYEFNDKLYVDAQGSETDPKAYLFYPVDLSSGVLGTPIDVTSLVNGSKPYTSNNSLYATDPTGIYSYDIINHVKTTILLWNNTDLDRTRYSETINSVMLSNNAVSLMGMSLNSAVDDRPVSILVRQDKNPNIGKQTITVAGLDILHDSTFLSAVSTFNMNSTDYQVEIKDYMADKDYSKLETDEDHAAYFAEMNQMMYLDILSGSGPDIVFDNFGPDEPYLAKYETDGLLLDINPLIEADTDFHKEEYLVNIFEACETDGSLYKIPLYFSIEGLGGRTSVIGEPGGWTVDEFTAMAESLPEGVKPITGYSQMELLLSSLSASMKDYVDQSTGSIHFDSAEFVKLLEWAKTYGFAVEPIDEGLGKVYSEFSSGQLALLPHIMNSMAPFITMPDVDSVVGFPSASESSLSCRATEMMAITNCSDCPEGSWEFIKMFLSDDMQTLFSNEGIPVKVQAFEASINDMVNPQPITDGADGDAEGDDKPQDEPQDETPVAVSEEIINTYRDLVYSVNTLYFPDQEILGIVEEDVQAYFSGQKSAEEVSAIIQNRVQILVYERGNVA